jgi:hypothetical protein
VSNDSSTGGFLQPVEQPPVNWEGVARGWQRGLWADVPPFEGKNLYSFLQAVMVGISGLPGERFFPRWQPEPPNLPDGDWAAFGITRRTSLGQPYIGHHPDFDVLTRHEQLHCLASFYGPNADSYSSITYDGLYLPQNNEPFVLMGFGLNSVGDVVSMPALVKQRWLYRFDVDFIIVREINRTYPVLDLRQMLLKVQTSSGFISSVTSSIPDNS